MAMVKVKMCDKFFGLCMCDSFVGGSGLELERRFEGLLVAGQLGRRINYNVSWAEGIELNEQ